MHLVRPSSTLFPSKDGWKGEVTEMKLQPNNSFKSNDGVFYVGGAFYIDLKAIKEKREFVKRVLTELYSIINYN